MNWQEKWEEAARAYMVKLPPNAGKTVNWKPYDWGQVYSFKIAEPEPLDRTCICIAGRSRYCHAHGD